MSATSAGRRRRISRSQSSAQSVTVRELRLELTEFKDWADIAELLRPLFEEASVINPSSELKKQADEIAARTTDKKRRAEMALRLVQEQLRYVYVALGTGGYIPLQADDAWSCRYGDLFVQRGGRVQRRRESRSFAAGSR